MSEAGLQGRARRAAGIRGRGRRAVDRAAPATIAVDAAGPAVSALGVLVLWRLLRTFGYAFPALATTMTYVFFLWDGGLTLYGGIILAILATVWVARRRGDSGRSQYSRSLTAAQ